MRRVVTALLLSALSAGALAQANTPVKRIVRIGITDSKGHPAQIQDSDVQLLADKKPILFTRLQPAAGKYIVLVDVSGSNRMKVPFISQSVRRIFDLLTQRGALTYLGVFSDQLLMAKSPMDSKSAGDLIDRATYKGGTTLYDALIKAAPVLNQVTEYGARAGIIVITDGEDNESSVTPSEAIKRIQQLSIPVYALDLIDEPDRESSRGHSVLKSIGSQTGGGIIVLDSPRDFSKELGDLIDSQQVFQIDEPTADVDFKIKADPKFRVSAPQKLRIIPPAQKK